MQSSAASHEGRELRQAAFERPQVMLSLLECTELQYSNASAPVALASNAFSTLLALSADIARHLSHLPAACGSALRTL